MPNYHFNRLLSINKVVSEILGFIKNVVFMMFLSESWQICSK